MKCVKFVHSYIYEFRSLYFGRALQLCWLTQSPWSTVHRYRQTTRQVSNAPAYIYGNVTTCITEQYIPQYIQIRPHTMPPFREAILIHVSIYKYCHLYPPKHICLVIIKLFIFLLAHPVKKCTTNISH